MSASMQSATLERGAGQSAPRIHRFGVSAVARLLLDAVLRRVFRDNRFVRDLEHPSCSTYPPGVNEQW
jgi:hypothetical protein